MQELLLELEWEQAAVEGLNSDEHEVNLIDSSDEQPLADVIPRSCCAFFD